MAKNKKCNPEDLFRASMQADFMLKPNSKYLESERNLAAQFLQLLDRCAWITAFLHPDEIAAVVKMRKRWKKRKKT